MSMETHSWSHAMEISVIDLVCDKACYINRKGELQFPWLLHCSIYLQSYEYIGAEKFSEIQHTRVCVCVLKRERERESEKREVEAH